MSTTNPSKETIIQALKDIFNRAYSNDKEIVESNPNDAMEMFFQGYGKHDEPLTEKVLRNSFPNTGAAFAGVTWSVVQDDLEGEGGPSIQRSVVRFVLPDGEAFFLEATFEWVSWDGFYYDQVADTIREVHPREKIVIEYV